MPTTAFYQMPGSKLQAWVPRIIVQIKAAVPLEGFVRPNIEDQWWEVCASLLSKLYHVVALKFPPAPILLEK